MIAAIAAVSKEVAGKSGTTLVPVPTTASLRMLFASADAEDAADKVQTGAKSVANKIREPKRDLGTEYRVEKTKEKLD